MVIEFFSAIAFYGNTRKGEKNWTLPYKRLLRENKIYKKGLVLVESTQSDIITH